MKGQSGTYLFGPCQPRGRLLFEQVHQHVVDVHRARAPDHVGEVELPGARVLARAQAVVEGADDHASNVKKRERLLHTFLT